MKKNTQLKWFKQHDYGYGWTPITWQGWLILLSYIVLLISYIDRLIPNDNAPITKWAVIKFIFIMIIQTYSLFRICVVTGGKPKWRWGKK